MTRLSAIEEEWEAIEASYRIDPCFAPVNQAEEREKLFAAHQQGQTYNPQFVYEPLPELPTARVIDFMAQLRPATSSIERLYLEKAQTELLGFQAVQDRSPDSITSFACYAFGLPSPAALEAALAILKQEAQPATGSPPKDITAEDAAQFLQQGLLSLGLVDWSAIVFEPMNARVAVNRLDRQVKIRRGASFSKDDLQRLLIHEIGVHVARFENGCLQNLRLFSNTFPRYMAAEEGLAVYSEQAAGLLQDSTFRVYAGRVLAAYLSLSNPFYVVFSRLAEFFDLDTAFEICARAKRGLADTSLFGSHTKDIVYLTGFLEVSRHLEQHPDHHEILLTGKFGLQHLDLVLEMRDSGQLSSVKYLPTDLT